MQGAHAVRVSCLWLLYVGPPNLQDQRDALSNSLSSKEIQRETEGCYVFYFPATIAVTTWREWVSLTSPLVVPILTMSDSSDRRINKYDISPH